MATTTIRGFIKKVAWGLFGNGSQIDANAITKPFVVANGWDSNKANFPSDFASRFGVTFSIPFWVDNLGSTSDSQVQVLIDQNGKVYARKQENNSWTSWVPQVRSLSLSLPVANWSSNSQTITATGVTTSNNVIISPAPASIDNYVAAGIKCTAQAANSLTFTCTTTPTAAISVNVLVMN